MLGGRHPSPMPILRRVPLHEHRVPGATLGPAAGRGVRLHPQDADAALLGPGVQAGDAWLFRRWGARRVPLLRHGRLQGHPVPRGGGLHLRGRAGGAVLLGSRLQHGQTRLQRGRGPCAVPLLRRAAVRGHRVPGVRRAPEGHLHVPLARQARDPALLGARLHRRCPWLLGRWFACGMPLLRRGRLREHHMPGTGRFAGGRGRVGSLVCGRRPRRRRCDAGLPCGIASGDGRC
mmetsp:Transcript_33749/g.66992  ORF Transcript_33749/g.66992 Transcript_33749/m.66992 type:complete len:233 (-) Transcript_33749:540-1238(-)